MSDLEELASTSSLPQPTGDPNVSDTEDNESYEDGYPTTNEVTLRSGPYYSVVSTEEHEGNEVTTTHATFSFPIEANDLLGRTRNDLHRGFVAPTSVRDREDFPHRNHTSPLYGLSNELLGWGFRFRDPRDNVIRRVYIKKTRDNDASARCAPLESDEEKFVIGFFEHGIRYDEETDEAPEGGRFDPRIDDFVFPRDEDENMWLRVDPRRMESGESLWNTLVGWRLSRQLMLPMVDSMVETQFNQIGIQTGRGDKDDEQAEEKITWVFSYLTLDSRSYAKYPLVTNARFQAAWRFSLPLNCVMDEGDRHVRLFMPKRLPFEH